MTKGEKEHEKEGSEKSRRPSMTGGLSPLACLSKGEAGLVLEGGGGVKRPSFLLRHTRIGWRPSRCVRGRA